MPYLPLDYPEPFSATLGVMLYPRSDESDQRKARAYAAQFLGDPIRDAHKAGHNVPRETLLRIAVDAGIPLIDINERWENGLAIGDIFKAIFALYISDTGLASWNNAIKVYERVAARAKISGSRSALWVAIKRYQTVAHLWAAWSIREGQFRPQPEIGYDGYADFQSFLTEAEILRQRGQSWCPPPANSKPFLPRDVWRAPEDWQPPIRRPDWPPTGTIPYLSIPKDLLRDLMPAGRPRQLA